LADVERPLYEERTLMRVLAMRRTMVVMPADLPTVTHAACTKAMVPRERKRLAGMPQAGGITRLPDAWRADAARATPRALAELGGRWLRAFGPGTVAGLRWWSGWTVGQTREALRDVEAVEVRLEPEGGAAFVMPDDVDPVPRPRPWAAFLPALDATVMGWAER